jgi:hypothetical protein
VGVATLVGLDPLDDSMNPIALGERVLYFLQNKDATTFGSAVPVGGGIKRLALARGAKEVSSIKTEVHLEEFR